MVFFDHKYTQKAFYVHYEPYIVILRNVYRSLKMSDIRLETPASGLPQGLIAAELAGISHINYEFLRVLTDPATEGQKSVLGLDAGVLAALRRLTLPQLTEVAAAPQLLAEFDPMPGCGEVTGVADRSHWLLTVDKAWRQQLSGFANRLLTCLWQTARHDSFMAAFCTGLHDDPFRLLAQQSFTSISRGSSEASACLRARLGAHPSFWPDLIRSVRNGTSTQRTASRMSLIQLSVTRLCAVDSTEKTGLSDSPYI